MNRDEKQSENNKIAKRIWKIRDIIQDLEVIKDEIIKFLQNLEDLDENMKEVWISDAKEFYYNTVAAWEMLKTASEGNEKRLDSSKGFLYAAQSRLAQSTSELETFKDSFASELISKAQNAFNKCWDAFTLEFEKLIPIKDKKEPILRVIKVSNSEYSLPCSVCGETAVIFKLGYGRLDKEESLVFRGITHESSLRKDLAESLFQILETENLSEVHLFMKKHHGFEGLDAYCPNCDKIYCWEHYNAREVFDDGFYDCTYGICPNGHKRMIDD